MPVTSQSGVPNSFSAGDTLLFSVSDPAHPAPSWYLDYVLSRNGSLLLTSRAAASGNDFAFTVSATASRVQPGMANFALIATEISSGQREVVSSGPVAILYNPATSITKTSNMLALEACDAAITKLVTSGNRKVDFDGQMFEKQNLSDLQKIRDRLQVLVNDELRKMGISAPGGAVRVQTRFVA